MKLSDYVAQFLAAQGVDRVFGVTGGAVVHLFDSVARRRGMKVVFTHHEQAAAFAAPAYAKAREGLGVAFVTTGPGGTNAITGLAAAWLDSVPCLYISGQTRRAHTTEGLPIRQLGTQQLDIVSLVRPLTKSAVMLDKPESIRFELERAVHLATSGRPGPVWLDIPLDFQWSMIAPESLRAYRPPTPRKGGISVVDKAVREVAKSLRDAERPLILAGGGIRSAGAVQVFDRLVRRSGVPFLTTWNATDYVPSSYPGCMGRPGMFGQRGANMVPSACDLLVSIGTHVPIPVSGTRADAFAPQARRLVVNIDSDELDHLYVPHSGKFCCDAGEFLRNLDRELAKAKWKAPAAWRQHCLEFKKLNEPESKSPDPRRFVDPYQLVAEICGALKSGDSVVVDGGGTINQITFQSFLCGRNQRIIISGALCSMGSGLPESIGVSAARPRGNTIMLCGDGSFQFNVQELQTIRDHNFPIKMFVINNEGYLSIRHTQGGFLGGRYHGSSPTGGLRLPDIHKVASAYGIPCWHVSDERKLSSVVRAVMSSPGPALCEVVAYPDMEVVPRPGFEELPGGGFRARPFDDMLPFMPREERARLLAGPARG
jgi:acetolactate synthase-1/2/3 large subunit